MDPRWGKFPCFLSAFGMMSFARAKEFGLGELFEAALAEQVERGFFRAKERGEPEICGSCGQVIDQEEEPEAYASGPKGLALDEAIERLWQEKQFP